MKQAIEEVTIHFDTDIVSNTDVNELRLKYLGKKGELTLLMKDLQGLTLQDKKLYGPLLNDLKISLETQIKEKSLAIDHQPSIIDLTIPGTPQPTGHLHPTTAIIREINTFFRYHGFSVQEGPELEDVEYNFRRLNLPEGHPATDLQDSLFVQEPNLLMRTHTSSVETRILSEYHDQLPLRVVAPGKCYRNETNSLTNTSFFYQYQGFVVDKGINVQNLKSIITEWFKFIFGKDVVIRFRYKYYPEVSPGLGQDIQCQFCMGKGCPICKHRGWIEMGGSGMIHYNTLKACGIDPEIYTGYAFGIGLDRMVMNKYKINDIRKLYGGEIVYKWKSH